MLVTQYSQEFLLPEGGMPGWAEKGSHAMGSQTQLQGCGREVKPFVFAPCKATVGRKSREVAQPWRNLTKKIFLGNGQGLCPPWAAAG